MIQLSFVDYLFSQSDALLIESERANQELRWKDADRLLQEWVRVVQAIEEWRDTWVGKLF